MALARKILRVNLTKGTCVEEPVNQEWVKQYLGQRGLATKYLASEIDPKVDPLSPENKLIFTVGPLTGTMAATGGQLLRGYQGSADKCNCLRQFRRLFRQRTALCRLGHADF